MKYFFVFLTVAFFWSSASVSAQIPNEVMTPYKQYKTAIKAKEFEKAADYAYDAWRNAEATLGDHKTTGDLAQNYGDIARHLKKRSDILKAYERSADLARFKGDDAVTDRLEREVLLGENAAVRRKLRRYKKRLVKASEFAIANGQENSTLLGEIYTMLAQIEAEKADHKDTGKYAALALETFEKSNDGYVSFHPYLARLYSGYSNEGKQNTIQAALDYQDVMQNLEGGLPHDHPLLMRALGRWMTMRQKITNQGDIEEAEAQGLCKCWPYDKERNESVQPAKRVPPIMPRNAWRSGFSIVEFDLDDEGKVINPRLLESWPEKVFDKSSMVSVKKWKYSPRTKEETDADRKDIVTTVTYLLTDEFGKVIE